MFATAVRFFAKKGKPKLKPIELKTPPEQTQTITRAIFDIVKEQRTPHGLRHLGASEGCGFEGFDRQKAYEVHFKMDEERQKIRLICNHVGPQKQFLYTTWFTKPKFVLIILCPTFQKPLVAAPARI